VLLEHKGLSPAAAFARLRTTARWAPVEQLAGIVLVGARLPRRRQPNPTDGKADPG
jgi:hypothetical protein